MSGKNSPKKSVKSVLSLEEALERLEKIIAKIEIEPPPLEQLISSYEEGASLVKICQEKLSHLQKRVEVVHQQKDREISLEPLPSSFDEVE